MGLLTGVEVIEFAGIGAAAMVLAEMGATLLRIDRVSYGDLGFPLATKFELLKRSRRIIRLDLNRPDAVVPALRLVEQSDALIEGLPSEGHGASRPRPRDLPCPQPVPCVR
jgi:alpha-methylacyl-CoA racemase